MTYLNSNNSYNIYLKPPTFNLQHAPACEPWDDPKIQVWDLKAAELVGLPTVLREGKKLIREAIRGSSWSILMSGLQQNGTDLHRIFMLFMDLFGG